jgi:hypothetical protein
MITMNPSSQFTPISEPRLHSFESVDLSQMSVLYAAAIVNPFGPTLAVLATEGPFESGVASPIIRMSLNPFSQDCEVVGEATIGDNWNPFTDLKPFLGGPLKGCPSLLLPPLILDGPAAIEFFGRYLSQFDDGNELLAKVNRFPNDPWNRIQADVDGPKGVIGKLGRMFGRSKISNPALGRLDKVGSRALAGHLLDESAMDLELKAFMTAWEGAIQFQTTTGLAAHAMSLKSVIVILFQIGATCRIPKKMRNMLNPDGES